ncbi:MAG: hypothetical protein II953_00200, partial [Clostridia bacterium]|nr:hypothetical protein [Clostridia bacterium]
MAFFMRVSFVVRSDPGLTDGKKFRIHAVLFSFIEEPVRPEIRSAEEGSALIMPVLFHGVEHRGHIFERDLVIQFHIQPESPLRQPQRLHRLGDGEKICERVATGKSWRSRSRLMGMICSSRHTLLRLASPLARNWGLIMS